MPFSLYRSSGDYVDQGTKRSHRYGSGTKAQVLHKVGTCSFLCLGSITMLHSTPQGCLPLLLTCDSHMHL